MSSSSSSGAGTLEAARARALAAIKRRAAKAARATTGAAAASSASAVESATSSDGAATSAGGVAVPPPKRARKRRFDIYDPATARCAPAVASDVSAAALTGAVAGASASTATVAEASSAALDATSVATAAAAIAAPSASASIDDPVPADVALDRTPPQGKRTRWGSSTAASTLASSVAAAASSDNATDDAPAAAAAAAAAKTRWGAINAAASGITAAPSPAPSISAPASSLDTATLALMPPADAAVAGASEMHDAAGSNDGASAPSDPSTALVCIEGGSENGTSIATGGGGGRRTRFSTSSFDAALLLSIHDSHLPPNFPLHVACKGMTTGQADAVLSHLRLEAIEAQLKLLAAGRPLDEVDPLPVDPLTLEPTRARSPSPEPIYDPATGVRVNTRRERLRVRLLTLQKRIVSEALLRSPNDFRPPAGFRRSAAGRVRFEAKLLIPLDEYPDYNFKGVIIGARGANQQELERRTGCKIAVRGKGSQSDNKPESMRRHYEGEDEPQHCWIQADTEEALARGVAEVKKLLVPLSDEERRKSLQALFEANGWVREAQACRVCGSTEHLMRACPDRNKGRSFVSAAHVSCRLCGARTHPTLDCPTARAKGWSRAQTLEHLRSQEGAGLMDADERVDADYERFIQELLGGDGEDGDEDGGEGSESKEMLPKRNRVSMSSSSVPTIARGANGMQLALLPPTTREQHEAAQATAAMLKQHESFREYTPHSAAREQQVQAHAQPAAGTFHHPHPQHHPPLHPSLPSPSHYANGGGAASSNGWSTTQLLVPPPPPPPPPPPLHVSHPPSMVLAAALAAAAALPLMPPPPPPPVYAGPTFSAFAPLPTVMSMAPRAQVLCPWEPPPPGL